MNIGITYETREDYSFSSTDLRYVDFRTAAGITYIKKLLEQHGHHVTLIGSYKKLLAYLSKTHCSELDIIFNASEGLKSRNREGWVPSLLEMYGVPYVGTDAYGLSLSLNKIHTKIICGHIGVKTPGFYEINDEKDIETIQTAIRFPCVLKPNCEGTSSGISLIENHVDFCTKAQELLKTYDQTILCERYIDGRELTVSLIGNGASLRCLGIVETVRNNGEKIGIYGIKEKFTDICKKQIPILSDDISSQLVESSKKIHQYLGCMDYSRADFRLDSDGQIYFLELNPIPDLAMDSSYPMCCELQGMPFGNVLEEIVQCAVNRYPQLSEKKK